MKKKKEKKYKIFNGDMYCAKCGDFLGAICNPFVSGNCEVCFPLKEQKEKHEEVSGFILESHAFDMREIEAKHKNKIEEMIGEEKKNNSKFLSPFTEGSNQKRQEIIKLVKQGWSDPELTELIKEISKK